MSHVFGRREQKGRKGDKTERKREGKKYRRKGGMNVHVGGV